MTEFTAKLESPELAYNIIAVIEEMKRAEAKRPDFPTDIIHMVSVMSEESGEATRAALQLVYEGGSLQDLKTELIQTAAMCLRVLKNLK